MINKHFPNASYVLVGLLEGESGMSEMKAQSLTNEVSDEQEFDERPCMLALARKREGGDKCL